MLMRAALWRDDIIFREHKIKFRISESKNSPRIGPVSIHGSASLEVLTRLGCLPGVANATLLILPPAVMLTLAQQPLHRCDVGISMPDAAHPLPVPRSGSAYPFITGVP